MHVWSKGDKCLAPYGEDEKLYEGKIHKIKRDGEEIKAVVTYDGYGSECEDVPVSKLQPISPTKDKSSNLHDVTIISDDDSSDTSFFKPLTQAEIKQRLEEKYADLDDYNELDRESCSSKRSKGNTKRKKEVVVTGGKTFNRSSAITQHRMDKDSGDEKHSDLFDSKIRSRKRINTVHEKEKKYVDSTDKFAVLDEESPSSEGECLSDEDSEKPKFNFTPCAAKVPYTLSKEGENPIIEIPATMNRYLRNYQREGVKFLYANFSQGKGALLGDDMGLGKTVQIETLQFPASAQNDDFCQQVIAFMSAILGKQGNKLDVLKQKPKFIREMSESSKVLEKLDEYPQQPFLIIGPGSCLYNWMDELDTWGYFSVGKFHGAEKAECLKELQRNKYDVVVTTYETFRDSVDELSSVKWLAVMADEVQKIKGLNTRVTKALQKITTHFRYGLTGTALQNNMTEIWSLLDWVQPGSLGSLDTFKEEYVIPIEQGQKQASTKQELAEARQAKEKFSKQRNKMMLRRTKKLIADQLPVKDDNVVFCKLSDLQLAVYEMIIQHPDVKLLITCDDPCSCGSAEKQKNCCNELPDGESSNGLMFRFMHLLLKTANHVALLLPSSDRNISEYSKRICNSICAKFPEFFTLTKEATFRTLSDPKYCGKMKILHGLLKVFYKDHSKVLIFSYSTKVLDIIEQYMMTTGYEYRRLDGSVSMKQRLVLVREFNKDSNIFVFLISTKAGGLGLNLTGANRVIIFDPSWNPTNDLQAQDRAYRLGQRKDVHVYRLLSAGTIEEIMYLRQIYKQQLDSVVVSAENARRYFNGVSGNKHYQGELFGIKNMFQLHTGDSCLTMNILKRNENIEANLSNFDMTKYVPVSVETKETESEATDGEFDTSADSDSKQDHDKFYSEYFELSSSPSTPTSDIPDTSYIEGDDSVDGFVDKFQKPIKEKKTTSIHRQAIEPVAGPSNVGKSNSKDRKSAAGKTSKSLQHRGRGSRDSNENSSQGDSIIESFTNVKSVFEKCGVLHIHQNRQVIGGSKAEDHMSRCAVQEVYELHQNLQAPAALCEPMSESSSEEEKIEPKSRRGRRKKTPDKDDPNRPRSEIVGSSRILIGQTPVAIQRKHFKDMSTFDNSESVLDFAERVLRCTESERQEILKTYYCSKNPKFKQVFEVVDIPSTDKPHSKSVLEKSIIKRAAHRKRRSIQENETLGLSIIDLSDEESLNTERKGITKLSSKEESLEIGQKQVRLKTKAKAVRKNVKTTDRFKSSVSKQLPVTHTGSHTFIKRIEMEKNSRHPCDISENESEFQRKLGEKPIIEISSDQLIEEIGIQNTDEEDDRKETQIFIGNSSQKPSTSTKHCVMSDTSILDDIFGASPAKGPIRKPPPGSHKKIPVKSETGYMSCDLFSDSSTATSSQDEDCQEKDIFVINESTLKDNAIDCFSDPTKHKRRKRKGDAVVNKLMTESEEEYNKLFETGVLRKKSKPVVIVPIEHNDEPLSDRTPSLF